MIRLAVRVERAQAPGALAELLAFSPLGVEEVDVDERTVEYVLYGAPGELPELGELRATVGEGLVEVSSSQIADDWDSRWRSFHRPAEIAQRIRVRPPWHERDAASDLIDIVIDPGQAFGTGSHPTTRLCLELLVMLAADGRAHGPLLDIGTGSGVLAIAAQKLGFAPVAAIDNEAEAVEAAIANAAANGVEIDVSRADLRTAEPPEAPVIVANLLRPLLLDLAEAMSVSPWLLIASGLLADQADEVARAFAERHGLRERTRRHEGEWAAVLLERAAPRAYP
ncbi:MAG TPA: 50S ribosomal protein L11 methyltransferase [Solirubrobacteraceae bacterium]|nr:50S ribosomal protein L11 methyltransferase [Solirubrobacteraceae bacterium]